jgi:hypothetical protein
MSEHPRLEAGQLLLALSRGNVRFVLIGGLAAQVHGSPSLTFDVVGASTNPRATIA